LRQFATLINDINRPADREYEDIVEKIYDVELLPVNFADVDQTLNIINTKVYEQTSGQISGAVQRDDILKVNI
jgi:serine protease inhibitor